MRVRLEPCFQISLLLEYLINCFMSTFFCIQPIKSNHSQYFVLRVLITRASMSSILCAHVCTYMSEMKNVLCRVHAACVFSQV